MSTPTLRRLNDREKYFGLTWPGWVAVIVGGGLLYLAIQLSPFGFRPTVTITLLAITAAGMVWLGVSGQALSPGRQLIAIWRYHRAPKRWTLDTGDLRGLVLDTAPPAALTEPTDDEDTEVLA